VSYDEVTHTAVIDASTVNTGVLPAELSQKMRGSVLFLGPLLQRMGMVELPGSGGCDIGTRKIDFHHRGFARLGANVEMFDDGTTRISMTAPKLKGALLYLDMPSHTGTENLMMGAALAEGLTIIENASVEPEVIDFGHFLIEMGADIEGLGTPTLYILVIGLLMMSAAITGGDIVIHGTEPAHLRLANAKLEQMGVEITVQGTSMRVRRPVEKRLHPINITTHPYPGYPTDLQPCISTLSTIADGKSFIRERIFENRYDFVDGLLAMGADMLIQSDVLIVNGVTALKPARVRAASIRAGAAVLLASLAAQGESWIENIYQIDRGHESIETHLSQLGANITRVTIEKTPQTFR
jgi:UDP-N-acetylglucosamine 1-carboxyvinyltransferase